MKYQHILITGASSGLGAALALQYASPGIRLSLHGRDHERLSGVAELVSRKGSNVNILIGDIREKIALTNWIVDQDNIQPLDLVIANAGISAGTGSSIETDEQIDAIFSTNLHGVLNTINAILPSFISRKTGQIAIVSSMASFRGFSGAGAYCASKAAIRTYGEALRAQCLPFKVAINVVCPGFIKTPMTDVNRFAMPGIMSAERAASIIQTGLASNRPRIAFPISIYVLIRLMNSLPQTWLDNLLRRLPKKGQ